MRKNKITYSLTVEDIQTVANDVLERDLLPDEIEKIIDPIAEKINWFDAIADSINEAGFEGEELEGEELEGDSSS